MDAVKELGGFTIVHSSSKNRKKDSKIIPVWIRNHISVASDLKYNLLNICDMPVLDISLKEKLYESGYFKFFPVQEKVIPWLIEVNNCWNCRPPDVCVSSPTGSGKTLTFVLPLIQLLRSRAFPQILALVVVPVQNLSEQIYSIFKNYCYNTDLKVLLIGGQERFEVEQKLLVQKINGKYISEIDVLISTPGRLIDHMQMTEGFNLNHLKFLVIDEADKMLDGIKNNWLKLLNQKINIDNIPLTVYNSNLYSNQPQKLLFSATITHNPEKLQLLNLFQPVLFATDKEKIYKVLKHKILVNIAPSLNLTQYYLICNSNLKPFVLYEQVLSHSWNNVLCFTNSIETSHRLYLLLMLLGGLKVGEFSSRLNASNRNNMLKSFEEGDIQILVSTDSLARGIDLKNVEWVVSYNSPTHLRTYIHRVGRTARAGNHGFAVTMLSHSEVHYFLNIIHKSDSKTLSQLFISNIDWNTKKQLYQNALKKVRQQLKEEKSKSSAKCLQNYKR